MDKNDDIKKRIINGISFFTNVVGHDRYDSSIVQKYLPEFLNLVAAYIAGEKINVVQLDEKPRGYDAAKIVFGEDNAKEEAPVV